MKEVLIEASAEPLLQYFDRLIPLHKEEKELVLQKFHPRLFRKRQYALQEGDIATQFYFVVRGCLRMYKIDDKGNTHIIQFAAENWWLIDLGSFHGEKPTQLNIDALEDTMVLQINHADLISLYKAAPKFDRIFRVLIENSFVKLQERLLQTISSTAEDRYQSFINTYPHLVNRLPQTQIASFLGITPEFLSRLRNRQAKALGTLGVASLAGAAYQTPEKAVLFYATDDSSINGDIEQLIKDNGFEPVRVGDLDQSIRLEVFGNLHEFGALGKTVTAAEAKEKI